MGTSTEKRTGLSRLRTAKARFVIAGPPHVQAAARLHRLGAQGMARARQTISTPVCQVQVNTRSPEYHQSEKRIPSTRRTAPCHAPIADARAEDIVGIGRPVASTGRKQVSPNANAEVVWVVRTPATIAPANRIERITLSSPKKAALAGNPTIRPQIIRSKHVTRTSVRRANAAPQHCREGAPAARPNCRDG